MSNLATTREECFASRQRRDSQLVPTIVHIIGSLDLGGAEMMLCKLLSTAELSCFRHCVVSLGDEGVLGQNLVSRGIAVHGVGLRRGKLGVGSPFALFKVMRQARPDLVQGWTYHGNLAAVLAAWTSGRRLPVLWNIRHTPYDLKAEKRGTAAAIRLGALLSGIPRRIIYNAGASAELHAGLGYRKSGQTVIPNGFELDRFQANAEQRQRLRNELGLAGSALLVGLIARLHPVKGHQLFLQAASLLVGEFPRLHFVLAGRSEDKGGEVLSGWIRDLGLQGRVHLLGERRDIPEIMAGLDCLASSSYSEAFPNVIGEAMASEVPCVVTDVGDCARLVGDTGIVVQCEPSALAAGMARMLRMHPEARRQLGRAARDRIAAGFSLPAIAGRYRELYRQVIDEA